VNKQHITTPKTLIHNTLFNVLTVVSNAVITFCLIRFFLGQLGEDRYGIWVLIASIFRYRDLLSMGLNSAVNRYIPIYLARNDTDGIQRVINTSLFFFSTLAVVLVLISVVIYYNIGSWFAINPDMVASARMLVLVVGFCFAFSMPLQPSSAVLSGLQRYDIINLAVLAPMLLQTALLIVLLSRGYGLITMGLVFGISEIVVRILQFIFARKLLPQVSISFRSIDFRLLREMVAYGINTFLYTMGAMIIYKASNVVIGIYLGTAAVSQFAVAIAGVLLLSQLLYAFAAAIKPAVSDLDTRNDESRVREISFLTQKYSLLLIIPSGFFMVLMGREFLWIWVGEKFQDPAIIDTLGVVLAILAVGNCLRLAQHSNFLVLVGRGEHRLFGVFTTLMALLCISASVVSVKIFNLGLLGIAWSNFLPMALISGIALPIYFNWKMKISTRDCIFRIWRPALLGCIPTVAMISAWKYLAPPNSWFAIAMVVVSAITLTLISSWFLSLDAVERKRFVFIVLRKTERDIATKIPLR